MYLLPLICRDDSGRDEAGHDDQGSDLTATEDAANCVADACAAAVVLVQIRCLMNHCGRIVSPFP
jgi:hypothetical protein